jgi:hypothetical protein
MLPMPDLNDRQPFSGICTSINEDWKEIPVNSRFIRRVQQISQQIFVMDVVSIPDCLQIIVSSSSGQFS